MRRLRIIRWALVLSLLGAGYGMFGQDKTMPFKVLVMAEQDKNHGAFVDTARVWLNKVAADNGFIIEYIENSDKIDEAFLSQYAVFLQLNYPPYMWSKKAMSAFEKYITEGKIGWVGLHHATLLGEFDGYKMWSWFSIFMGGIRFENYIAGFASATVNVEDSEHPVMKGVPVNFVVAKDEWYTYNKNPRSNVHVLASVDEASYVPETNIKMGDHPVVWTNENVKARNVYIFMGHHPNLFRNESYKRLLLNAILWAGKKDK